MKNKNVLYLTQAAMIAALYVVLTMIANALGIASGNIQVRFSEALTVLPFLTPAAVPGLFIGCLIANLVTGAMLPDIIFGSLATLIGAIGTWMLGKAALGKDEKQKKLFTWLSPLPPILANAVIIPPVLKYAYGILPMWFSVITVTAGEIISCGIFGLILLAALKIQKPVVPRLNGKKQKRYRPPAFWRLRYLFSLPAIECTLCEHSIVMNMQ